MTSSTEAEFVSLCTTVKEAIWLRNLALELHIINEPITIKCDNTSTIQIASNKKAAKRTRHLGAQIHYPKEQIENGFINIEHVPSGDQLADMLTKPLGPQKFIQNRKKLMTNVIMTMLAITCLFSGTTAESYRFDTVTPILYGPTAHFVEDRIIDYEIDFTYIDPCKSIANPQDTF